MHAELHSHRSAHFYLPKLASLSSSPSERGLAGVRLSFKGLNGVGSEFSSEDAGRMSDCL